METDFTRKFLSFQTYLSSSDYQNGLAYFKKKRLLDYLDNTLVSKSNEKNTETICKAFELFHRKFKQAYFFGTPGYLF